MNKILVVVDMQNDFITGALGSEEAQKALIGVTEKVKAAGDDTIIFFTLDTHGDNYLETSEGRSLPVVHCIEHSSGWELAAPLAEIAGKGRCICKNTFGSKELVNAIREAAADNVIKTIELAGVCTDVCVISNALLLKAYYPEADFIVDARCCAGITPESHEAALTVLESCHVKVCR